MNAAWKPSKAQLEAAASKRLRDLLAPNLQVVFCGINPGLYSAAIGHNFGRPGNRFWPALFASGFTPRLFSPFEDRLLLELGLGMTNVVPRTTATADQLRPAELTAGGQALQRKMLRWKPRFLAVLGVTAYRSAFAQPKAVLGLQPQGIGETKVWVLPNPSGLNAHYQPAALANLFSELRDQL